MKRSILFLLAVLLLLGCQPTPEEDFIVNKGDGVMTKRIDSAPVERTVLDVPAHVTLDPIAGQGVTICTDAEVLTSGVTAWPVAEIVSQTYDAAWARRVIEGIACGRPVTMLQSEIPVTKAQIAEEIRTCQNALEELDAEWKDHMSEAEWKERRKELFDELAAWEEAYRNAPDSIDSAAPDLSDATFRTQGRFSVSIDFGKAFRAQVDINVCGDVRFDNWDDEIGRIRNYTDDCSHLNGVTISKDDAVRMALNFMAQLGETGYEPALVQAGYCELRSWPEEVPPIADWPQCYCIYLTRPVDGVPTLYAETQQDVYGIYAQTDGMAYVEPCGQEFVELIVRDSGINSMQWLRASTPIRTVNESVELVPFDEILSTFQKRIAYEAFPLVAEYADSGTFTLVVDRISLGMYRVRKKDASDTFLMIPVWTFYGKLVLTDLNEKSAWILYDQGFSRTEDGMVWYGPGYCYLRINAIDGSVIDPRFDF